MARSRHGLVEVGQVLLGGVEKQDGGSLGTQRPIPGGTACLRGQGEGCQGLAGRPGSAQPRGGWYLVLGDLMGHELLQQVEVDRVAGLGAAGGCGSLQQASVG